MFWLSTIHGQVINSVGTAAVNPGLVDKRPTLGYYISHFTLHYITSQSLDLSGVSREPRQLAALSGTRKLILEDPGMFREKAEKHIYVACASCLWWWLRERS